MANPLGRHLLAEFIGCKGVDLDSVQRIKEEMENAALEAGATIVQSVMHHFNPYGVSGVVVISESHLAIHTWPEYDYAAIDVFTCGEEVDPQVSLDYLARIFEVDKLIVKNVQRGDMKQILSRKLSQNKEKDYEKVYID
jgi:S-adenosylmethionine decarboxylase proenzyme